MGNQNQGKPYALVVMTNNDVYYMSIPEAKELKYQIKINEQAFLHEFIDAKSGAEVGISTEYISSIVIGGKNYA